MRKNLQTILILSLAFSFSACTSKNNSKDLKVDARFQKDHDQQPVKIPAENDPGNIWDRFYNKTFRQIYRLIDIRGWTQEASLTSDVEAKNVNAWDEVPDSSWFTNRIGKGHWTPEQAHKGPRPHEGPNMSGSWTVVSGKSDGVSAGFVILDAQKDLYFVKLDPPGYQELASGAEVVASLLMHSAGYYVPAYYAMSVSPKIFKLGKKAKIKGKYGVKRKMTQKDLDEIIATVATDKNKKMRLSISYALPGEKIGPFHFEGTRSDDPNDRISHEHRRELRGYHVFGAWVNNTDIRFQNTLDMFQKESKAEDSKGYLRHYMIDYGTALGAAGNRPKDIKTGYEEYIDYSEMGKSFVRLGARDKAYWKSVEPHPLPSVGTFEAKVFDPARWRTQYNNRAFELMTPRDGFWAAKIIARFTDEHLRRVIDQAKYSSKEAADYILATLKERQRKIVQYWFQKVTPIDDFEVVDRSKALKFYDLAVAYGDQSAKEMTYEVDVRFTGERKKTIRLQSNDQGMLEMKLGFISTAPERSFYKLRIKSFRSGKSWGEGVKLNLVCQSGECLISGVERPY